MDDAVLAELRALRVRAYGPDADIEGDPLAQARLRELEAPRAAAWDEAAPPRRAGDDPGPPWSADDPSPAHPADDPSPAVTLTDLRNPLSDASPVRHPEVGPPRDGSAPTLRRMRLGAVWTAALVAAALVGAGIATIPTAPESSVAGAHYYSTIRTDGTFTTPNFLRGYGGMTFVGFRDYLGLTPIVTDADWSGASTDACLLITATANLGADAARFGGALASGCGADPFPATATLVVDGGAPDLLRRTFGEGTVLQFVLGSDVVDVFKADAPAQLQTFEQECTTCQGSGD